MLFGAIKQSTTRASNAKTILHLHHENGLKAWMAIQFNFKHGGSSELMIDELEDNINTKYTKYHYAYKAA